LSYATPPPPKSAPDAGDVILYIGRRCVFAIGVGLFMYGVGNGWMDRSDVGESMGWGAALAAVSMPWGWRKASPWEK
jgi:hypothetical protein